LKNSKIKNYLEWLQALSEGKKKIILWTIVAVLAAIMGFFWIRDTLDSFSKFSKESQNLKIPQIEMLNMPSLDILSDDARSGEARQTTTSSGK